MKYLIVQIVNDVPVKKATANSEDEAKVTKAALEIGEWAGHGPFEILLALD